MTTVNTASLPTIRRDRLLQRFLSYVRVETTADPTTDNYPSSPGQLTLGTQLLSELKALGIADAEQDEHGLVWGTVPATVPGDLPTVLLNSHLDTSPESPGKDVQPQVVEYTGGDIPLPKGDAITVDSTPELARLIGKTLITSDGTTLLGGDDKAGVAIIMELAATLIENPHLPHGPVRILFTCDEEIGRGATHFDRSKADALVGYTLDGGASGTIDNECFSADAAVVTFTGSNIHPSIAKGRMINASRAASLFVSLLPRDRLSPESTDGRDGFIHPHSIRGGVDEATVHLILRDFVTDQLDRHADVLRQACAEVERQIPGIESQVETTPQYRNMADGLRKLPMAVELALQAFQQLGVEAATDIIRGGTDGAQMTGLGLPTPNLSSGQYNIHSRQEFACLDEMELAIQHAIQLLDLWQQHGRS